MQFETDRMFPPENETKKKKRNDESTTTAFYISLFFCCFTGEINSNDMKKALEIGEKEKKCLYCIEFELEIIIDG